MARYKSGRRVNIGSPSTVKQQLAVIISGVYAGTLRSHGGNYLSFEYAEAYVGPNLSVAMQRDNGRIFDDRLVKPVIMGLLPDNVNTRAEMAYAIGVTPTDIMALLAEYGLECPGAVQICAEDDVDDVINRGGAYEPIDDSEIRRRLLKAESSSRPIWHDDEEHWSLGGNQGKIALARIADIWNICHGSYPSTHIIKPGVSDMPYQALVEFVSMQLASKVGIAVADTDYCEFDGLPVIVISRYDRGLVGGKIVRYHQEDMCQALGYLPDSKYDVTTNQVTSLLSEYADSQSLERFTRSLFYNYLIGGSDAHAKNYSMIHLPDGSVILAPLYDVASILPYKKMTRMGKWRHIPMSIGGETRIGALTGSDIRHYAEKAGVSYDHCISAMTQLANNIPEQLEVMRVQYSYIPGMDIVLDSMVPCVTQNCRAMLRNINRTHHEDSFVKPGLAIINSGKLPWEKDRSNSPVNESKTPGMKQAVNPSVQHDVISLLPQREIPSGRRSKGGR